MLSKYCLIYADTQKVWNAGNLQCCIDKVLNMGKNIFLVLLILEEKQDTFEHI